MKKKILALCLVVVLVATAITGITLAYFTDVTETATNVFTAGNVDIDLKEPSWNPQEKHNIMPGASFPKDPTITVAKDSEDCYVFLDVTLNKYKSLFPVMALWAVEQEDIDVTAEMIEQCKVGGVFQTGAALNYFLENDMETFRQILDAWFVDIEHANWEIKDVYYDVPRGETTGEGDWMTVRLAYIGEDKGVLSAGESVQFMSAFTMPKDVTEAMLDNGLTKNMFYEGNNFEIDFTAYAIQAQELANVGAAYDAYFAQN